MEAKGERACPLSPSDRLYQLIALCYEATSADGGWSHFASELTHGMSATCCAAITLGGGGSDHTVLWSHGAPPSPIGGFLPVGFDPTPLHVPGDGIRAERTPDGRFLTGLVSRCGNRRCFLVVAKPTDAPEFSRNEIALLGELLPHIDRALQVYRTIRNSENRRGALTEILDRLPEAIFLIDRQGNVVSSNLAARAIAQLNDGLSLIDDRIGLVQPGEQETLRTLIDKVASRAGPATGSPARHADGTMTMSVSRPSGKTAFPIVVTPVKCRGVPDGRPAIVAAVITKDTEQRGSVLVPDLAVAFGLTPGEKRLAGLVAGGLGLKEAAEMLGITRNTVRTHMKRVYAKTGVHSQADLVRLLSRGSIELRLLEPDG